MLARFLRLVAIALVGSWATGVAAAAAPTEATAECTVHTREGLPLHVDGQPVGRAHLFERLQLTPGKHQLWVPGDCAGVACELEVTLVPGRVLRVTLKPGELPAQRQLAAVVMAAADVVALARRALPPDTHDQADAAAVERALRDGLRTRDAQLLPLSPASPPCDDRADCLLQLGQAAAADYVLALAPGRADEAPDLLAFDVQAAQIAASAPLPLLRAAGEQNLDELRNVAIAAFVKAQDRPRAAVVVDVKPRDAVLRIDDVPRRGTAGPLVVLAGPHRVAATRPYFLPATAQFEVAEGDTATVALTLTQAPLSHAEHAMRTLRWVLLGVGLGSLTVGAPLLAAEGRLDARSQVLMQRETLAPGAVLTSLGAATLVGAAVCFGMAAHDRAMRESR